MFVIHDMPWAVRGCMYILGFVMSFYTIDSGGKGGLLIPCVLQKNRKMVRDVTESTL